MEKESKINKKIKIISERVNAPFQEVEKEKEENLEQELELEIEEETFTDFISSEEERTAPVLKQMPIPETENLEQEVANAPSTGTTQRIRTEQDYANMPDYGTDYEQRIISEEMGRERERGEIRIKDISDSPAQREQGRFNLMPIEQVNQLKAEDREMRRYSETGIIADREERELPFRRRERKRERILK